MLVDVEFRRPDMVLAMVAGLNGGPATPEHVGTGMYLACHWNVGDMVRNTRNRWQEDEWTELPVPESGVCDSPQQLTNKYDFNSFPEPVFISFVRIRRAEQPREDGWRWHKWGEYIGDKEPQCEYLSDEPEIEEVYTFTVHELHSADATD